MDSHSYHQDPATSSANDLVSSTDGVGTTVKDDLSNLRIAVLEDSLVEGQDIERLLKASKATVSLCTTGDDLLSLLQKHSFDLIVLDWNVPGIDGFATLGYIRNNLHIERPVLMLTSRNSEVDVVQALSAGADDYLTKPWRPFELLARLKALMRRSTQGNFAQSDNRIGSFELIPKEYTVVLHHFKQERAVLTQKEYSVALLLLNHLGRPVSRAQMLDTVWSGDAPDSRTVDAHVSRVRNKLKLTPANGYKITAIYGFGYRLEAVQSDTRSTSLT